MTTQKHIQKLATLKNKNRYFKKLWDNDVHVDVLSEIVLAMPARAYRVAFLQQEIAETFGTMAAYCVNKKFLLGLSCMNERKISTSFTLGLDEITIH